jgi:ABC-type glycerol-3-phosphate transport system substrate-binding protein
MGSMNGHNLGFEQVPARQPAPRTAGRFVRNGRRLIGGLAGAVLLAACGASGASSPSGSGASTTTLVVWEYNSAYGAQQQKTMESLNAAFEAAYPHIKIDDVSVSFTQMPTKFTAAIAAQAGPDVVTTAPGVVGAAFRNGLTPLQGNITPTDRKNWLLLNEAAGPGGDIYAIPWTQYGYFLYYNKHLFAQAGLNPDDPPSTWQEFIKDCQALKAHGITALSGGFKDGYEWEWWAFPLLDQLMSPSVTKSWLQYNYPITAPVFQTVWSDIKALAPFFAPEAASLPLYEDAYNNFNAGKAAMVLDAPTIGNLVAAQKELGTATVGVFPVPRLADSKYPPFIDAGPNTGWGITKWAPDKTAAWDYIQWMEGKQAQELAWSVGQTIPNNAQAVTSSTDPAVALILKDLKNPLNRSVYTGFPVSVLAINERYAGEMISGQMTTSSVLNQMEQLRQELRPKVTGSG